MATIQARRGLRENLPSLGVGEPAFCSDTEEIFIGSGERNVPLAVLPDQELVTIEHGLGGYPLVLLLALEYGAGVGGAGETPAGGTDPVQYPCRAVYHSTNSLTVYATKAITGLGAARTLSKMSNNEYLLTFDGISADSLYVKLILNMGAGGVNTKTYAVSPTLGLEVEE